MKRRKKSKVTLTTTRVSARYRNDERALKKLLEGKCVVAYCRNDRPKHKSICWKHKSRLLKERHLATYTFNLLRCGARRRGIAFTLTLKNFIDFCQRTNYLVLKGQNPDSLTVDRINHDFGYAQDNIKVSTHAENSFKKHWVPPGADRNYTVENEPDYVEDPF